ncbi:MarR family winged helix-turn-helix transcriptional regulator [Sphingomonas montana]|uniref:MarR family winged helix-turn-helix transcriptional regulator n=1 Tax=Sphingomonas montana TaxID=1843236 RepID=UPI00101ADD9F|nr:MarR family transcriptional regulator [Sphingomonas montana]
MKLTMTGTALSETIFDLLRLNSRLLTAGDRLVASVGLTSARWQVLGTMIAAERPQPVAWIARDMSGNRQNVQRIVNDLERDGLVEFRPNPHHRRAQLVVLTEEGKKAYDQAMQLQAPWVNSLSEGLPPEDVAATRRIAATLRLRLEEGDVVDA